MDYSKEQKFVDTLNSFISPDVQLKKLKIMPTILNYAEKANAECIVDAFPFLRNKTPINKILDNMETFKQIDSQLEGKTINLTSFLENNVNLV